LDDTRKTDDKMKAGGAKQTFSITADKTIKDKLNSIVSSYFIKSFIIVLFFLFTAGANAQQVTKVLVSGISGNTSHDADVKNAFLLGYASYDGTQFSGQIDLHLDNSAISAIQYADQNNYQIAIRSYIGLSSQVDDTAKNHPDVLFFMPAGSNGFYYVCNLDIPNAVVVSTGAGLDTLVTGYKVEFFSIDPITSSNLSSFSNGYIAGQIAYLANKFNITPQQARLKARNYASPNSQSATYVQYGEINLQQAVQNESLPVELTAFTCSVNQNSVTLKWSTSTEVNNFGFNIEKSTSNQNWENIGFVQGHGNSNSTKEYSFVNNNLKAGSYSYRLKQIDNGGSFKYSSIITLKINQIADSEMGQNYPNPFNPTTTIQITMTKKDNIRLVIYNIIGQQVAELVNGEVDAGTHNVTFNAGNLTSGIYFYTLSGNSVSITKKMILMK
jgi:hypothetical protein